MNTDYTCPMPCRAGSETVPALCALSEMIGNALPAALSRGVQTLLDQQISAIETVAGDMKFMFETMDETEPGMTPEERITEIMSGRRWPMRAAPHGTIWTPSRRRSRVTGTMWRASCSS